MGNACSDCFEGIIKSLDRYDTSNTGNHAWSNVNRSQRRGEREPLLSRNDPKTSYESQQSSKIIPSPSRKKRPKSMTFQQFSELIRSKMLENIVAAELSMREDGEEIHSNSNSQGEDSQEDSLYPSYVQNEGSHALKSDRLPKNFPTNLNLPKEFLKLYDIGRLVGIGTTAKVFQLTRKKRKYITTPNGVTKPLLLVCKVIDKRKLILQMNYTEMDPLLKQLRREVDILRRLHHPNIVTYYDFMETKQQLFIITEYLSGGELFDYLATQGPLSEEITKYLLYDIFDAIAYLHSHKIIHRDIKTENCIFDVNPHNPSEIQLKLIDFGFSISIESSYMTSSFLGTYGYIAPEISQNRFYNVSVDNWALGILLYCMISAKMPFKTSLHQQPQPQAPTANTNTNTINSNSKVQTAVLLSDLRLYKLRFPDASWSHISSDCKDLIRQLLQIDPVKRLTAKNALLHPWVSP